jgi:hypothetical protein
MICLGNEHWTANQLASNIHDMVESLKSSYPLSSNSTMEDRFVKWNQNNHSGVILNVDGSCLGSPTRTGYGGILRNVAGFYLSGFS